jgi:hypothetical protein
MRSGIRIALFGVAMVLVGPLALPSFAPVLKMKKRHR